VPIVVFTGLEDDVVGLWALSEGAEDYVIKGKVSSETLAWTLCEAIERHKTIGGRGRAVGKKRPGKELRE